MGSLNTSRASELYPILHLKQAPQNSAADYPMAVNQSEVCVARELTQGYLVVDRRSCSPFPSFLLFTGKKHSGLLEMKLEDNITLIMCLSICRQQVEWKGEILLAFYYQLRGYRNVKNISLFCPVGKFEPVERQFTKSTSPC